MSTYCSRSSPSSQWTGWPSTSTSASSPRPASRSSRWVTDTWVAHLPWVLLGLCSTPWEEDSQSPALAVLGFDLVLPGQFLTDLENIFDDFIQQFEIKLRSAESRITRHNTAARTLGHELMCMWPFVHMHVVIHGGVAMYPCSLSRVSTCTWWCYSGISVHVTVYKSCITQVSQNDNLRANVMRLRVENRLFYTVFPAPRTTPFWLKKVEYCSAESKMLHMRHTCTFLFFAINAPQVKHICLTEAY